jgi:hypothetical protein
MKIFYQLLLLCLLAASCEENAKTNSEETTTTNEGASDEIKEEKVCTEANSFIPEGWKIIATEKGDLNKDGISDLAYVIQNQDKAKMVNEDGVKRDENPRELIVLFGTEDKNCYELAVRNSSFILANDNEYMDDPYQGIEIKNGTLRMSFSEFYTMGSWTTTQFSYVWRYQDGEFKLIGANSNKFHRADGDAVEVSANFSTKKYSVTNYNMFEDEVKEQVEWKKMELNDLKTFWTFKKPWTWTLNEDMTF